MTDSLKVPALMTFGKGGHQIYYRDKFWRRKSTLSGYSRPDDPTVATDLPDGLPVINKRAVIDNDNAIHLLISGPMVNVSLDDGEADGKCKPGRWRGELSQRHAQKHRRTNGEG